MMSLGAYYWWQTDIEQWTNLSNLKCCKRFADWTFLTDIGLCQMSHENSQWYIVSIGTINWKETVAASDAKPNDI